MSGVVIRRKRRRMELNLPPVEEKEEEPAKRTVDISVERKEQRRKQAEKEAGKEKKTNIKKAGSKRDRPDESSPSTPAKPTVSEDAKIQEPTSFGNALSSILERDLGDTTDPVLARRRTAAMKAEKEVRKEESEARKSRMERKRERSQYSVDPNVLDRSFERELRRVATRGVVALFNAVSKHQKALEEEAKSDPLLMVRKSARDGRMLSDTRKDHFLQLLDKSKESVKSDSKPPSSSKWAGIQDKEEW